MPDATRVCDRLVLLNDGRTIAEGTLAELHGQAGKGDFTLEDTFLALVAKEAVAA